MYTRARMFVRDDVAYLTYTRLQDLVHDEAVELSVFHVRIKDVPFVVVLGEHPGDNLDRRIVELMSRGYSVELDESVYEALRQRRDKMKKAGQWVEGHYRPGRKA